MTAAAISHSVGALELRLRLDRFLAELRRREMSPSVEEWAEAIAVALASLDLVAGAPERFAARLRPVLLKSPEPAEARKFREAFEAAFGGDLSLDQAQGSSSYGRSDQPPSPPQPRRWIPGILAVAALIALLGVGAYLWAPTTSGPDGGAPPEGDTPTSPDTPTLPRGEDLEDGTLSSEPDDPLRAARLAAEIGFRIHLSADSGGRVNLRAIAQQFRDDRPPGMTPAHFLAVLSRRTGVDPSSIFALNGPSLLMLIGVVHDVIGGARRIDGDVLKDIVDVLSRFDPTEISSLALRQLDQGELGLRELQSAQVQVFRDAAVSMLDRYIAESQSSPSGSLEPDMVTDLIITARDRALARAGGSGLLLFGGHRAPEAKGHRASWLVLLLAVGLPIGLLAWQLKTYKRRLRAWFHRRSPEHGITPHYLGGLHEALDRAVGSDARVRAARDLARPLLQATTRLDAERTAIATARNAGRLAPVHRQARRTPRYLVLVITEGPDDHQAQRYVELVRSFGRLRTTMDCWYIDHDGNSVYQRYDERRQSLDDLRARLPDYRLLVFGTGEVFIDPATMRARPWATGLSRWPVAALLTPRPVERWSAREAELARLFNKQIAPATPEGLAKLAQALAEDTLPELRRGDRPEKRIWEERSGLLTRQNRPKDRDIARLKDDLRSELGEAGLFWLRAAAVYPAINWDLTLFLGQHLKYRDEIGALITPRRFARLAALPWMREGYMPTWARRWLTDELSQAEKGHVVNLLCGRLGQASFRPSLRESDPVFVTADADDDGQIPVQRDRIFLDLVAATPPEGEGMAATAELAERFAAARRDFRLREGVIGLVLVLYGLAAIAITPSPWRADAIVPGSYLPLAGLLSALVLAPLAYRLLRRIVVGLPAAKTKA